MISLRHGTRQRFRYRHGDINLIGDTHLGSPVVRSEYSLNGGPFVHFYVEPEPQDGRPNRLGTRTAGLIRLSDRPGSFNIEIPVATAPLRDGENEVEIRVQRAGQELHTLHARFTWDSRPVPQPLSLDDLGCYTSIQDIGQVVDGHFEIDPDAHVIRTVEPVGADVLLLLGSPLGNQEATYDVRFSALEGMFLGLSDFFVGHEPLTPELGIKPGYSSAGLATVRASRRAEAWLMRGALLENGDSNWTLSTPRHVRARIRPGVTYRVRHQVIFEEGVNLVRFRIWPKDGREPMRWLCEEHDADLDHRLPRFAQGSFGLFQYGGRSTEWSNIDLRAVEVDDRLRGMLRARKSRLSRKLRTLRRRTLLEERAFRLAVRLKKHVALLVMSLDLVAIDAAGSCLT